MESLLGFLHFQDFTFTTIISFTLTLALFLYQILYRIDYTSLSVSDVLWTAIIRLVPSKLLLDAQRRQSLTDRPQLLAAKSEAMRKMLGLSGQVLIGQVPGAAQIARRLSMANPVKSIAPPGLGNWDNSCYQNSVIQGLSSLKWLEDFLDNESNNNRDTTVAALHDITTKLRDSTNNGSHIWTPAKLKSMSSWQQQDAQEYYSKIMDELDKETFRVREPNAGLESAVQEKTIVNDKATIAACNPLEGFLSQQVACTSCGYSEGISLIPFNCLTIPLMNGVAHKLEDCLNEYTKVEPITGVECTKCTLLNAQHELQKMANTTTSPNDIKTLLQLPAEVRAQVMQRLIAVNDALEADDFTDETLNQKCQISKKSRVASTKTRQALIGRPPKSLVVHVNRSVFDELSGMQSKNYAAVRYPAILDLGPWVLGSNHDGAAGLPREHLWKYIYRLKAIVTHYGRHENGHYIAYRQAPTGSEGDSMKQQWWRLSDEDVTPCSDEDALNQGGVFMLFYERVESDFNSDTTSASMVQPTVQSTLATQSISTVERMELLSEVEHDEIASSTASMTGDESDLVFDEPVIKDASTSPFLMRTAGIDLPRDDHWTVGRFIAAT